MIWATLQCCKETKWLLFLQQNVVSTKTCFDNTLLTLKVFYKCMSNSAWACFVTDCHLPPFSFEATFTCVASTDVMNRDWQLICGERSFDITSRGGLPCLCQGSMFIAWDPPMNSPGNEKGTNLTFTYCLADFFMSTPDLLIWRPVKSPMKLINLNWTWALVNNTKEMSGETARIRQLLSRVWNSLEKKGGTNLIL